MSMADEIKSRVKMPEVFDRYGLEPNRAGFIRCPFHQEKTASLSAFHNGERWKCFGCGAGGDVISFVMQFFGIGFSQALLRMDLDFGLGLSGKRPDLRESRRIAAERAAGQGISGPAHPVPQAALARLSDTPSKVSGRKTGSAV